MITVKTHAEWQDGMEGFFMLPEKVYRLATGICQSDLKLAFEDADLIKQAQKRPRPSTHFQELGTLVHAGILEPDTFGDGISHWVQPSTYTDAKTGEEKEWSGNSNTCKAWSRAAKATGRPIIDADEQKMIARMIDAFRTHSEGAYLLQHAHKEIAVFHRDPETGLMWKGRLDILLLHPAEIRITDIKTCAQGDADSFGESAAEYAYHIQSSFYRRLVARAVARETGEHEDDVWQRTRFIHATIETGGSQFVRWLALDHTALHLGVDHYETALRRVELAITTGRWSRIQPVSLPRWKIQKSS